MVATAISMTAGITAEVMRRVHEIQTILENVAATSEPVIRRFVPPPLARSRARPTLAVSRNNKPLPALFAVPRGLTREF